MVVAVKIGKKNEPDLSDLNDLDEENSQNSQSSGGGSSVSSGDFGIKTRIFDGSGSASTRGHSPNNGDTPNIDSINDRIEAVHAFGGGDNDPNSPDSLLAAISNHSNDIDNNFSDEELLLTVVGNYIIQIRYHLSVALQNTFDLTKKNQKLYLRKQQWQHDRMVKLKQCLQNIIINKQIFDE